MYQVGIKQVNIINLNLIVGAKVPGSNFATDNVHLTTVGHLAVHDYIDGIIL